MYRKPTIIVFAIVKLQEVSLPIQEYYSWLYDFQDNISVGK